MTRSKRKEVKRLRAKGFSYRQIGRALGISHERARQLLMDKPPRKKPEVIPALLLRAGEAAQLLGLHPNTLRNWNDKGLLPAYRIGPRHDRRFRREDMDRLLTEDTLTARAIRKAR